jgi:hypothetical protein
VGASDRKGKKKKAKGGDVGGAVVNKCVVWNAFCVGNERREGRLGQIRPNMFFKAMHPPFLL